MTGVTIKKFTVAMNAMRKPDARLINPIIGLLLAAVVLSRK